MAWSWVSCPTLISSTTIIKAELSSLKRMSTLRRLGITYVAGPVSAVEYSPRQTKEGSLTPFEQGSARLCQALQGQRKPGQTDAFHCLTKYGRKDETFHQGPSQVL